MKFFRVIMLGLLGLSLGKNVANAAPSEHFFTLKNGLKVLVLPNHRAPTVSHLLWHPFGSLHDPYGKTGVAHYLEHMMFKGPQGSASSKISEAVDALGGVQNAMTTYDYTMYYNIVKSQSLSDVMPLESGRLQHLTVLDIQAKTELKVILEERRTRIESDPMGEFITLLMGKFFQYHPYRNPPIGWEDDLKNLKAEDCQAFHDQFYTPNHALLILAGDITVDAAKKMAEKYYGALPKKEIPIIKTLQEPSFSDAATTLTFSSPYISHPSWVRMLPLSLPETNIVKMSATLALLEYLLTVDPWGAVFKDLVKHKKIATSIAINSVYPTTGPSLLCIMAEPIPGISLTELEKELLETLEKIMKTGFTEAQLQKAKDQIIIETAYEQDSLLGPAFFYGEHLMRGASFEDAQKRDLYLQEVSLETINSLLKNLFSGSYHVTGYMVPQKKDNKESKEPQQ